MWLNVVWFGLFVIIIAGYLIMDGFDLGVGILHPFLAKSDEDRRVFLNSIGPVWDGNEVWLVLGGGVMSQPHLFPLVRAEVPRLLNGYVQSPALLSEIDGYIVPPGLGGQAGVLGAIALAQMAQAGMP